MMFNENQKAQMLRLAKDSIGWGLRYGRPLRVKLQDYDAALSEPGACFVTLNRHGQLRGCIGSLEAYRPLAEDISENAYAAAFRDPRFSPLQASELEDLELSLSILTPSQPMHFHSEQDLLEQIRPAIDGLVLQQGNHRGTFLPSVWQQLPDKQDFLRHLKQKAGLPPDFWSDEINISRYQTETIS